MNLPGHRLLIPMLLLATGVADAQQTRDNPASATEAVQQQVDRLAEMVNREQAALESSQRQIEALRRQVADLQGQLVGSRQPQQQTTEEAVARLNADVENIRERQEVQQSEIATHEQDKVESASKFPVKAHRLDPDEFFRQHRSRGCPCIPYVGHWRKWNDRYFLAPDGARTGCTRAACLRGQLGCGCAHRLFRRCQPKWRLLAKWRTGTIAHRPC